MTPKVLNKTTFSGQMENVVFIGRPSKWGNPFVIGIDGTRKEVIDKYRQYVYNNPKILEKVREELKGKDLLCFCSPKPCHGDVLLEIANTVGIDEFWS